MKSLALLIALLWSGTANAHQTRWSCDVIIDLSADGDLTSRTLLIDTDQQSVDDNGELWRNGDPAPVFRDETQFVEVQGGLIVWGLRADPPRGTSVFSLDPATGRYEMTSPDVGLIAHGTCSVPPDKLS